MSRAVGPLANDEGPDGCIVKVVDEAFANANGFLLGSVELSSLF